MNTYKRQRFPPNIISYAVWLRYRFNLSHRDIQELLAERDITVCREAIRLRCIKFGALFARYHSYTRIVTRALPRTDCGFVE